MFSDNRNSVVNSRIVGNTAKSSGFRVYKLTINTMIDTAILKVKNRSNTNGGNGSTIMARMMIIRIGPAKFLRLLSVPIDDKVIALFIVPPVKTHQ
jgi:hypothetical protein